MSARVAAVGMLLCVAALAGCQPTTEAGPVVASAPGPGWEKGPAIGLKVPPIQFTSVDGRAQWVRGNADWITLIAFVPTQGRECEYLLPVLADTAGRYYNKPIRVVQVAEPEAGHPHCSSCIESGHAHLLHLMALCDGAHTAYGAFGRPALGTLLVVGTDGKVMSIGSVDQVAMMYPKLDSLANALTWNQLPDYAKSYSE